MKTAPEAKIMNIVCLLRGILDNMKRRTFLVLGMAQMFSFEGIGNNLNVVELSFMRHATFFLKMGNQHIMVDPMLSLKGELPPFNDPTNPEVIFQNQPLIDLPSAFDSHFKKITHVLITHNHLDHFDPSAASKVSSNMTILCQPADVSFLKGYDFESIAPINDVLTLDEMKIRRLSGDHSDGSMNDLLGPSSGYLITKQGYATVFVSGDIMLSNSVLNFLKKFQPSVIVANAGANQFEQGGRITMNYEDLKVLSESFPQSTIVAIHMDAMNLSKLTRNQLSYFIKKDNLKNVKVPKDGERIIF